MSPSLHTVDPTRREEVKKGSRPCLPFRAGERETSVGVPAVQGERRPELLLGLGQLAGGEESGA